jgi:hypothetical protein
MSDLRKAAERALEMFDWLERRSMYQDLQMKETHEALRQALAQPEQEPVVHPVAHLWECIGRWTAMIAHDGEDANLAPPDWLVDAVKAAIAPPKREWIELTNEDIHNIEGYEEDRKMFRFAKSLLAKAKEKNKC